MRHRIEGLQSAMQEEEVYLREDYWCEFLA
jgi:hypothetical protein